MVGGKPTRTAGALAPRSGSGAAAALGPGAGGPGMPLASRRRDDQGVNVTMSLVADRRFVVIIVASFVCKTSVGQHLGPITESWFGSPDACSTGCAG